MNSVFKVFVVTILCSANAQPAHEFCRLPSDPGHCLAAMRRYFYNITNNKCEQFTYGGCEGNENNFYTKKHCLRICKEGRSCPKPADPIPPPGCRYNQEMDEEHCPKNNVICDLKPGKCPTEFHNHCRRDCSYSDQECKGNKKCCTIGCSTVCVTPVCEN